MYRTRSLAAGISFLLFLTIHAQAAIRITEWMYNGTNGEIIELTNIGSAAQDMTGWSYDDDSRLPNIVSLSTFGIVQPGQSVVLTNVEASVFRKQWGLASSVKILGGYACNLGRSDEINIYNRTGQLVDRLTFNDQGRLGPRTNNVSGNIPFAALGFNNPSAAMLSAVGDVYGSWRSPGDDLANPGTYFMPEPVTFLIMAGGAVLLRLGKR